MRVIVPIERDDGLKSIVAQHFGRAPFFAIVEFREDGSIEAIRVEENTGEHLGGRVSVEDLIGDLRPDALVVRGMGPRGLNAFQSKGIAVFTGDVATLQDAVRSYVGGGLRGLTEPCREARHRF